MIYALLLLVAIFVAPFIWLFVSNHRYYASINEKLKKCEPIVNEIFRVAKLEMNIGDDEVSISVSQEFDTGIANYNHETHNVEIGLCFLLAVADKMLSEQLLLQAIVHELQHHIQFRDGKMKVNNDYSIFWNNVQMLNCFETIALYTNKSGDDYNNLPWEKEANDVSIKLSPKIASIVGVEYDPSKKLGY